MSWLKVRLTWGMLLPTWVAVFLLMPILTGMLLVPWDTFIVRPEIGTWQRTLNDFFEVMPGNILPALIMTLTMIIMNVLILKRNRYQIARVVLLNWGLILFMIISINLSIAVNYALFSPPYVGYQYTALALFLIGGGIILWFWQQYILLTRKEKRKREDVSANDDTSERLSLSEDVLAPDIEMDAPLQKAKRR